MGLAVVFAFIGLGWSVLGHLSLAATIGVTFATSVLGAGPAWRSSRRDGRW